MKTMSIRLISTILYQDLLKIKQPAYSNKKHIISSLNWLKRAQDVTLNGGVSAWYSLLYGWTPSYIETTGYIIETFLNASEYLQERSLVDRALKMGNFLLDMVSDQGGFRSKTVNHKNGSDPVIFNTGQDILGIISLYEATHDKRFLASAIKAADFLVSVQDISGCWIKYQFGNASHTYDTRVSYALLRVWSVTQKKKYKNSAIKALNWASGYQNSKGWFDKCNFPPPNPKEPYTHAISYVIEGLLYSGIILSNKKYIMVAKKAADAILKYYFNNGAIPGTFDCNWKSQDLYSCLTGDAQISVVWLELYKLFKDDKYLQGSRMINKFLKSTQVIDTKNKEVKGAIKGSFPIYGDTFRLRGYSRMAYPNWAAKFFIDALILEDQITK